MRIGEMVRRTGVSERLLRYYEEQGLLAPTRLPSGYRVYSDADVDTVRRIRFLLAAGLPTALIARVLPCVRDDSTTLAPVCSDLVADLRRERERITCAINDLEASRSVLDTVIAAGPDAPEPDAGVDAAELTIRQPASRG
ncbi:MerR family transcriptional regulator [Streptomyces cinerochromogenes]|uniref:MerR family transcriptional regulator n=1 Tax=Streptomyces cinerochromogenes TaxID=66422 RepID=UPI0016718368|nr:MerR family transcriptional regulator [Streptomyces cinerochromogenes]GGS55222.1 MerR family transcriptional regulator [Streptomyces cinerochromogenes]